MSATYSNGTITQTGTDTDPTVFNGLTGVTITGTSEYRVVLFDGVKLVVDGTLSIPKYYRLYFINTSTVDFKINGTVNVDYFTTTAAGTVYHTTPWVEFGRQTTSSSGAECMSVYGTLNWRGGSILADPVIYFRSGATVLFNNSIIDSTNGNMFRIFTSNLTFEGPLTNIGKRTTINTSGITLDNYSPKGGGGLDHGGVSTDFTLNNFSPEANVRDSALRFNNGDSIFNASTGMNLAVLPFNATGTHPHNGGGCRLYRKVSTNIKDISNNPLQNVKTFLPSYDDSNRVNLTSNFGSGWDFTAVSDTTLTTAANGKSSTHNQILKVWYLLTTDGNDLEVIRFDKDANDGGIFTASSYKYGYLIQSNDYNLNGLGDLELATSLLPDANITESNKATVDAYPVTVSIASNTINVTGDNTTVQNLTSAQLYDLLAAYLEDNFGTYTDFLITRSGSEIDATGYNVNFSYINYTGDMVTDQVITLSNGSSFNGVRTDANGTVYPDQPISITNISTGSRMLIYNVTTSTEIVNTVVSGTSYTSSYQEGTGYNDGDTVRVYLTKLGKEEWVGDVIDTSNGFNVLASQVDNDVYTALGVDGTTVTKFQADYPNNEVDLIIGSDWTMAELYAWWANNLTTEDGIRNFFGGITAIDQANFRINTSIVDLYLDNTTNASYKQSDNRRFFRDTGTGYPVRNPTTSGYGLDVVWRNTILIAQTEAGGTSDLNFYDVKRAVKQVITNPKYIKGQK